MACANCGAAEADMKMVLFSLVPAQKNNTLFSDFYNCLEKSFFPFLKNNLLESSSTDSNYKVWVHIFCLNWIRSLPSYSILPSVSAVQQCIPVYCRSQLWNPFTCRYMKHCFEIFSHFLEHFLGNLIMCYKIDVGS